MPAEIDVAKLFAEADSGDQTAFMRFVELQRTGRGLRFYPNGRKGPYDDGVIGLAIRATGRGNARRIVIDRGGRANCLIFGREQAIAIFRAIQSQAALPIMEPFDTKGFWIDGHVVVTMPSESESWTLTLGEALTFANEIRDVLFEEAQSRGRDVMDLLEELGELEDEESES